MATPVPPDAKTLTNWEEAFEHYTIPQVRALQKQIQNDLGVNGEKLRALVGESYRDLLHTANKIIEMDDSMQKVESNLADASRNCNYRLMEKKARNVKLYQERVMGRNREKCMFVAQTAVLQGCSTELSRLLHRNGPCLLATRIFVVLRLVLKSLQEKGTTTFPIIASLRDQMTCLRASLLRHIDHKLWMTDLPTNTLVEGMCALALVKTSSPADLLRHFLNMRSKAISGTLDPSSLNSTAIHSALKIFHSTLQYTEEIFPKKISEALQQLKSKPLFDDTELRAAPGLNLEINEQWLPEDIRGFVPWVRHDELERSKVNDFVRSWANRELDALNESVKQALKDIKDIGFVVDLRKEILDSWNGSKSKLLHVVIGSEEPRRKLREQLNERLVELLNANADKLNRLGEKIEKLAIQPKETNADVTSLWSDALLGMSLSNGAALFRRTVKATIAGHDTSVKSVIHETRLWSKSIVQSFGLVKGIAKTEKLDEFDDDEFGLGSDNAQDAVEDSGRLLKALRKSLEDAYKALEGRLEALVREFEEKATQEEVTTRAIFLLRSIRHLRQNPPRSAGSGEIIGLGWFAKSLIIRLQVLVSMGSSMQALSLFRWALRKRKWEKECPSVPLWEGAPRPLPTQPSPDVFKFLHELVLVMGKAGSDIWTPATVQCLRRVVRDEVWVIVGQEIDGRKMKESPKIGDTGAENTETCASDNAAAQTGEYSKAEDKVDEQPKAEEGENLAVAEGEALTVPNELKAEVKPPVSVAPAECPAISSSHVTQLLYDLTYILKYALPKDPATSEDIVLQLQGRFGVLNDEEFQRIEASAGEYWKKTSLLFSLLT
ncbi:hypothetical protein L211DRAFT_806633 [Terfezia boudieri ATCC MYA-4762]|uniref:Conserved oligomeric Golgi complex subunit 1 n=1 Tax=Terfezia boudieri ATCC MYA-4762 TaxID=1051890 RepID=A0A3N4LXA2_9PEZI|nr:hypothetical protein L211DRAFT_806633 [Terfezia boudieri ATCC MYA-4762]